MSISAAEEAFAIPDIVDTVIGRQSNVLSSMMVLCHTTRNVCILLQPQSVKQWLGEITERPHKALIYGKTQFKSKFGKYTTFPLLNTASLHSLFSRYIRYDTTENVCSVPTEDLKYFSLLVDEEQTFDFVVNYNSKGADMDVRSERFQCKFESVIEHISSFLMVRAIRLNRTHPYSDFDHDISNDVDMIYNAIMSLEERTVEKIMDILRNAIPEWEGVWNPFRALVTKRYAEKIANIMALATNTNARMCVLRAQWKLTYTNLKRVAKHCTNIPETYPGRFVHCRARATVNSSDYEWIGVSGEAEQLNFCLSVRRETPDHILLVPTIVTNERRSLLNYARTVNCNESNLDARDGFLIFNQAAHRLFG